MHAKRDGLSLAALALCLGCESHSVHEVVASAGSTGDPSTTATTPADSGDTASSDTGSGGADSGGADSGGADSANTSSGGANTSSNVSESESAGSGGSSSSTSAVATSTTAGGAGGSGGQAASSGNKTHACLEYVLGFCEYNARCGGGPESIIPCFENVMDSCPDVLFAPGSARTVAGTFACADEWRALACEVNNPECALDGTLPDGEACVTGIQCASRYCTGSPDSCGTCMPTAELGEPCEDSLGPQCEPGLYCHGTDRVCVVLTGPVVGGLEIGEECDPTRSDCYPNLCLSDAAGAYSCEPYPTLGEDCSRTYSCAYGDSYCDPNHVCMALPAVNQFCGIDASTGAEQWCAEGLVCDLSFVPAICLATPAAPGQGESCDGTCQAGLTCRCTDEACESKTCQWARLAGESCASPEEACLMGECVDGTCEVIDKESSFDEVCAE